MELIEARIANVDWFNWLTTQLIDSRIYIYIYIYIYRTLSLWTIDGCRTGDGRATDGWRTGDGRVTDGCRMADGRVTDVGDGRMSYECIRVNGLMSYGWRTDVVRMHTGKRTDVIRVTDGSLLTDVVRVTDGCHTGDGRMEDEWRTGDGKMETVSLYIIIVIERLYIPFYIQKARV
jgi:hypothetical protein